MSLPEQERRVVAERLLDPEAVAQAWTDEALRRADALERGEVEALEGEAAIAGLEAKLRAIYNG